MRVRCSSRSLDPTFNAFVRSGSLISATLVACTAPHAAAELTLTPEGLALHPSLRLTTFATGFPVSNIGIGPFGIDYETAGTVLVTTETGNLYRFGNVDGQDAATATPLQTFGQAHAIGLAHVGTSTYMNQAGAPARIVQLNSNGSVNRTVVSGVPGPTGIVAHPTSGHLFVSTNLTPYRILDVNPATGTFTTFQNVSADGMSLSADGSVLYAALVDHNGAGIDNHFVGYSVATGAQVFDSGVIANVGAIDGSALGFGPLAGSVFINTRSGFLVEVNLNTLAQTIIASGGSRGDFVAVDPSGNGDMLITQRDRVLRLSGIPTPSTAAALALAGLMASRRRR